MKVNISSRVYLNNYTNRFQKLYQINGKKELKTLNFGIGEDVNLIKTEDLEEFSRICAKKENYGYSENICPGLKEAFSFYSLKNYGVYLQNDNLTFSMGIKNALNKLAFLLVNKEDKVLVTSPGYNVFERAAKIYGAEIKRVYLTEENNYSPDLVEFCKSNDYIPKIIQINYPNNPTGRSVNFNYYQKLVSFARENNIIVINDAAYIDYTFRYYPISILSQGMDNLIELYSASKSFGLTGARVGVIAGDKQIISALDMIRDQFDSGSSKIFLEFYKYFLLNKNIEENRKKYRLRYFKTRNVLQKIGFEVQPLDSTFYVFFKICENSINYASDLRKNKNILLIPYEIEGENYIRMSLTYKEENDLELFEQRMSE